MFVVKTSSDAVLNFKIGSTFGLAIGQDNGTNTLAIGATANDAIIRPTGTGNLRITDNGGTVKTSFLQNGNVGIGTASPNNTLEVNGGTRLGGGIDYGSTTVLSVAPGSIGFDAPGVSGGRFYISGSSGNVGIGTTSPNVPFHVYAGSGSSITTG